MLDLVGDAIAGLFVADNPRPACSFGYASGLSIGDSTLFGRVAGRRAAGAGEDLRAITKVQVRANPGDVPDTLEPAQTSQRPVSKSASKDLAP